MPTQHTSITQALGSLVQYMTQARDTQMKDKYQGALGYQANAAGDLDVARANQIGAVPLAMKAVGDSIASRGLPATLADPGLMAALAGGYGKPEAMSLLPGATPGNNLSFALAGGAHPTKDNVFSLDDRENVRTADAKNVQDNELAKIFATPVQTAPGNITTFAPDDTRGGPMGRVEGNTTDSIEKGKIRARVAAGDKSVPADALKGMGGGGLAIQSDGKGGFSVTTNGEPNMPLPKAVDTQETEKNIALRNVQSTLTRMRSMADDPTIFGVVGNTRRFVQDVGNQGHAVSKLLGGDVDKMYTDVASKMAGAGMDPKLYDPNLDKLHRAHTVIVYQLASALFGQSGRGLSNQDFKYASKLVPDPTDLFSTQANFKSGLDQADAMIQEQLEHTNQNIVGGIDVSAGASKVIDGVHYTVTGKKDPSGRPIYRSPDGQEGVIQE